MRILIEMDELPGILMMLRDRLDPDNPDDSLEVDRGIKEAFSNIVNHLLGLDESEYDSTEIIRELYGNSVVEVIEDIIERYLLRVCALEWVENVSLSTMHGCLAIHLIGDYTTCPPRSTLL